MQKQSARLALALACAVVAFAPRAHAANSCVQIKTPADLDTIRSNLTAHYCLAKDIDMSGVANFVPIGVDDGVIQFSGTFDGQGHTIRNLTINSDADYVGLFALTGVDAVVKNLTIENVRVSISGDNRIRVGSAIGQAGGSVVNVHASGIVDGTGAPAVAVGGLVGSNEGSVLQSSSAVTVIGNNSNLGGLAGENGKSISQSYATGSVSVPVGGGGVLGGLVGANGGSIDRSFATGPLSGLGTDAVHVGVSIGGLVGNNNAAITRSFATGGVKTGVQVNFVGGLAGADSGSVTESYAVGHVNSTANPNGGAVGGLIGVSNCRCDTVAHSYWDIQTTEQPESFAGIGLVTSRLQAKRPGGFKAKNWGVTPGVSFPYLTAAGLNFAAPLAITVKGNLLYTFLPISQLDLSQYAATVTHADAASLAAAYTIVARAIGVTDEIDTLNDVAVDTYFWDDAARTARWRGPVTQHATRGPLNAVAPAVKLDDSNVIGALRAREVVLLRGKYRPATGGKATQWMVATSFTTDADGNVTAVVADDPWTGLQVRIDPATKQVVAPADFPLAHFTVNAFQAVTLD
jgi:hypothetical protein